MRRCCLRVLLACFSATVPAWAAADPGGVVVAVDAWFVTPRNAGTEYAFVDDSGNLAGGGTVRTVEPDRDTAARFQIGWRLNGAAERRVSVTIWESDVTGSDSTGALAQSVGGLLATPDFAAGRSFIDSAAATTRMRGAAVDASFDWSPGPGGLRASAGIRLFRLEEELGVAYAADVFGELQEEFINRFSDARGVGPWGRLAFSHRFGRRYDLGAGVSLALPVGEIASRWSDSGLIDGSLDRASLVEEPGGTRAFVQLGGELSFRAELPAGWTLNAAYRFEYWPDTIRELRFVDRVSQNTAVASERDVVWEGFTLGAAYRF